MKAPAFWQAPRPTLAARLLQPIGWLVGTIAARRMARTGERARLPVICVGNPVAGGAGKTPTALALARILREAGHRPIFLTRGHGGTLSGPTRVDPALHSARDVGDEPRLLAAAAPTILAVDRPAGAALAAAGDADVIVMDDGLQNPSLLKDLALAVVDAGVGFGNKLCLPAGPLRAPMAAQWPRIDALVLVGDGAPGEAVAHEARARGVPVLRARLVPDPDVAATLAGAPVLAFAGIGRPEKFAATLREAGAGRVDLRAFADHHPYTRRELAELLRAAQRHEARLVTTAKDAARLPATLPDGFRERLTVLPVTLVFDDPEGVATLLTARLSANRPSPRSRA